MPVVLAFADTHCFITLRLTVLLEVELVESGLRISRMAEFIKHREIQRGHMGEVRYKAFYRANQGNDEFHARVCCPDPAYRAPCGQVAWWALDGDLMGFWGWHLALVPLQALHVLGIVAEVMVFIGVHGDVVTAVQEVLDGACAGTKRKQ